MRCRSCNYAKLCSKAGSAPVTIRDLEVRVEEHSATINTALSKLIEEFPDAEQRYHIRTLVDANRKTLDATIAEVRVRASRYAAGRAQLIHLAGVGLLVEVLAHELTRATTHTLDTLAVAAQQSLPANVTKTFASLEAQLRTLQKRLRILDPLSTRGRQTKEQFDLVAWVRTTLETHDAQFRRHGIRLHVHLLPEPGSKWNIRAVKGMVLQVLENLISNSVYWLKQRRKRVPTFRPEMIVDLDTEAQQIRFSDNGPGIEPKRQELIFQAFHSTKPPGLGNGLGLYIAREIAQYHGAALYLDDQTSSEGALHTFVFDFAPKPERTIRADGADFEELGVEDEDDNS
jgi:signal transduction histidine kinase